MNQVPPALGAGSRVFKSPRPDQPSLLSGAKNEGCRDEAKGEVGPQLELFTKATARHAFSSKTEIQKIRWDEILLHLHFTITEKVRSFLNWFYANISNPASNRIIEGKITILPSTYPGRSKPPSPFQIAKSNVYIIPLARCRQ